MLPDLPLVGREPELAWLRSRVERTGGGLVLLAGEAGIGKTRLLGAVLAGAPPERSVGVGICPGAGETPPFGPWRDLLRAYGTAGGADPGLLPPPFGAGPRAETGYDLALEVADFLSAGPPALLVLEDMHWADPASLELLQHTAARLHRSQAVLLATYRTDELHHLHPLHAAVPALLRGGAERLALERLSAEHVADLARAAGHPGLAAEVFARSGGNPFFARELLAARTEVLPQSVQQAIDERLRRLSPDALAALRVAAVLGREFEFSVWQAALEQPEDQVAAALDQAVALHLVREQGDRIAFDHALVREVLYAGLTGPRRRGWHQRAAGAARDPDAVAHHLGQAGHPAAVPDLHAAGNRALRLGARAQAAAYYDRALDLAAPDDASRPELLLLAAAARGLTDARAFDLSEEALQAAEQANDPVVSALTRHFRAWQFCKRRDERAVACMEAAHRELAALWGEPRASALAELVDGQPHPLPGAPLGLAHVYLMSGRVEAAASLAAATAAALGDAVPLLGESHSTLALVGLARGDLDSALHYFRLNAQALFSARKYAEAARGLSWLLHNVILNRGTDRNQVAELARRIAEASALAQERAGAEPAAGSSPLFYLWFWRGEWDAARADVDACRAVAPPARDTLAEHYQLWAAVLDCEQGDPDTARKHLAPLLPQGGPGSTPGYHEYSVRMLAMPYAARACRCAGDLPAARAWLETLDAWHRGPRPNLYYYAFCLLEWAEWHRAAGSPAAASRAAAAALDLGMSMGSIGVMLQAQRLLGALGGRNAGHHLVAALELAEAAQLPYEAALVRLERGRPEDLELARTTLARLGARPALARAEAALARLRQGPARGRLTPREVEIVQLVALGLTDREVGARLHISPRTVDTHLRNIFTKLNLPSRAGLVAWAVRTGVANGGPDARLPN